MHLATQSQTILHNNEKRGEIQVSKKHPHYLLTVDLGNGHRMGLQSRWSRCEGAMGQTLFLSGLPVSLAPPPAPRCCPGQFGAGVQ